MELDFVITGAPKSGTTYLDRALREAPGVVLPKEKETNFFSSDQIKPTLGWTCHSAQEYEAHFQPKVEARGDFIFGEVCPSYFFFPDRLISHVLNRNAPVFIILRDPLRRAISHYFMDRDRFAKTLPPPQIALTDRSALPYGAWGTGLNPFIDLSDYERPLSLFSQDGLAVKLLFFENGMKDNLYQIENTLGLENNAAEGAINVQRRLRSPLLRYLLGSPVLKAGYSALGPNVKRLISKSLYQPVDKTKYNRESEQLYTELLDSDVWKPMMSHYRRLSLNSSGAAYP